MINTTSIDEQSDVGRISPVFIKLWVYPDNSPCNVNSVALYRLSSA